MPTQPVRPRRPRDVEPHPVRRSIDRRWLWGAIAGLAIGGAVVGGLAIGGAFDGSPRSARPHRAQPLARPPAQPRPQSDQAPPPTPRDQITKADVRQLLATYADRYGERDSAGLGELFTSDVVRHEAGSEPADKAAALREYDHQFGLDTVSPRYVFSQLSVSPGVGGASASGRYAITNQHGTVTGSIQFHFVREGGRLLIDRIEIQSDQ
jgi:hypothetical protein